MNIAVVKFGGLAAGGTEKDLQTLASILAKNGHKVDYYFTNAAPYIRSGYVHANNSLKRKEFVESFGIKTIPIHVGQRVGDIFPYEWIDTNFWEIFDESKYDVLQTARGGHPEYPFNLLNKIKMIDRVASIHAERKLNVVKSILFCNWQADQWIANGGDSSRMIIIPMIVDVPEKKPSTLRKELGIPEDAFVYGYHQRNEDGLFSSMSMDAYKAIETNKNYFVLLGGADRHRNYAKQIGIKNIKFLDHAKDLKTIHNFLGALDVYAHARSDGEVCSNCMIEALYNGKPIVSHPAENMGHKEMIEGCGKLVNNATEYAEELKKLEGDKEYYKEKVQMSLERYRDRYSFNKIEKDLLDVYNEAYNTSI